MYVWIVIKTSLYKNYLVCNLNVFKKVCLCQLYIWSSLMNQIVWSHLFQMRGALTGIFIFFRKTDVYSWNFQMNKYEIKLCDTVPGNFLRWLSYRENLIPLQPNEPQSTLTAVVHDQQGFRSRGASSLPGILSKELHRHRLVLSTSDTKDSWAVPRSNKTLGSVPEEQQQTKWIMFHSP